jgi:hypothetical protein
MTILKKRHNKELEHNSPGSQGNQEQNCIVKAHTGYLKVELFFEGCHWFMIWSIILQTQLVRLLGLSVIRLGQSFLGFRIGTIFASLWQWAELYVQMWLYIANGNFLVVDLGWKYLVMYNMGAK